MIANDQNFKVMGMEGQQAGFSDAQPVRYLKISSFVEMVNLGVILTCILSLR